MRDIKNMIAHKMIANQTASLDFKNGQLPGTDSVILQTNSIMQVMAEEESNQQRRMNQYGLMGAEMVYQQPVVVEESYQLYDIEQQYQA